MGPHACSGVRLKGTVSDAVHAALTVNSEVRRTLECLDKYLDLTWPSN